MKCIPGEAWEFKALRLTCRQFAYSRTICKALFRRVHFYPSPDHIEQLAELSSHSFLVGFVREVLFQAPLLREIRRDPRSFQSALGGERTRDLTYRLKPSLRFFRPEERDEDWMQKPQRCITKGYKAYVENLDEQQALIKSVLLPQKWAQILKHFANLQRVDYAEADGTRCPAEAHTEPHDNSNYSWCDCGKERYGKRWKTAIRTPTERVYPECLLRRLWTYGCPLSHEDCFAQMLRALGKAQTAHCELHIGPGISLRYEGIRDEDCTSALGRITKFDYNPCQGPRAGLHRKPTEMETSAKRLMSLLKLMPSLVELYLRKCDGLNLHKYAEFFAEHERPTLSSLRRLDIRNSMVALYSLIFFLQRNNGVKHLSLQYVWLDRPSLDNDIDKGICHLFKTIHNRLELESFVICGLRTNTCSWGSLTGEERHIRPELIQYALRQSEWEPGFVNWSR